MATAATTTKPAETAALPTVKPRASVVDVVSLTTQGNGLNLWGHVTPRALADVLDPEYFGNCIATRGGGLFVHDRIIVTTSADSAGPVHATLVVTEVTREGVSVKVLDRSDRA